MRANTNFVRMIDTGRYDMVDLHPANGEALTYFNECPGSGGSGGPGLDDGSIVDPHLADVPTLCPRDSNCVDFPESSNLGDCACLKRTHFCSSPHFQDRKITACLAVM